MLFRNHENVDRRLWIDVAKSYRVIVLEYFLRGNSTVYYPAEQTIHRLNSRDKSEQVTEELSS